MAVIGQSHLIWRSRVADQISHGNTIVRIVPIEVGRKLFVSTHDDLVPGHFGP